MTIAIEDDSRKPSSNIKSPLDVVAKEVKQEDRLCRQVYYTLLSMYTNNPINLAINAPQVKASPILYKK
jgi:hypothetical protein